MRGYVIVQVAREIEHSRWRAMLARVVPKNAEHAAGVRECFIHTEYGVYPYRHGFWVIAGV
jgi:hypothetical protein